MHELLAIACYLTILLSIGLLSYSRRLTATDFILGSRSLNYWLTALAAHASDMSSWLFMAYPALIFTEGLFRGWVAIGLILCMYLNWCWIAPKIRMATEKTNSLTFSSFLENRFNDTSGTTRIATSLICFVFYSIYISAGLITFGKLIESLCGISYFHATAISLAVVVPYLLIGGYLTLAWIDLFQGLFLMAVLIFVPCYLFSPVGGWQAVMEGVTSNLVPDLSGKTLIEIFSMILGWGLGYFGQPAIVTKFMGIKNAHEMHKSKWIGMSWMSVSLTAATLVGLVAIPFFQGQSPKAEMVFIDMVRSSFHPFLMTVILCAVFAATLNVMSSQILVVCTSLAEDIYKKLFRQNASSKEQLLASRLGVLLVALLAFYIAYYKTNSIYSLVLYAWSGLGSAFGPVLIASLYSNKMNKYSAWAGIITGAISSAAWPYCRFPLPIDAMIPGFCCSFLAMGLTSRLTTPRQATSAARNAP